MKLYNSLGGEYQELNLDKEPIKIYLCGPTVQSPPHLGHGKSVVAFDILVRYLRSQKKEVTYVRNITDIDDKIIEKALEENVSYDVIAKRNSLLFQKTYKELNCLNPDFEPEATKYINEILELIKTLVDKGFAYETSSGIYFEVKKYSNYMELSNRDIEDAISGDRANQEEDKKANEDFVLWKKAKEGEPYWESIWGNGRPGWHIECSAMASSILGNEIDIHCGGNDLIFPHHENEIAQSQAGYGVKKFSEFWLHNGMLKLEGEKMAKSTGNIKSLSEYIQIYGGDVVRFFYLRSHYRSPQDFSDDLLKESSSTLSRIKKFVGEERGTEIDTNLMEKFISIMNDDLNTPKVIALLFESMNNKSITEEESKRLSSTIRMIMSVLGIDFNKDNIEEVDFTQLVDKYKIKKSSNEGVLEYLIDKRKEYRESGEYEKSDDIREELLRYNIELEDGSEGTKWFWRNS
ncbi:MAG: cysteine--tRNA ligase [Actinomycetota bacterium]|nr:cysteine--tRNA ligase [Actinomycetota bacterium]